MLLLYPHSPLLSLNSLEIWCILNISVYCSLLEEFNSYIIKSSDFFQFFFFFLYFVEIFKINILIVCIVVLNSFFFINYNIIFLYNKTEANFQPVLFKKKTFYRFVLLWEHVGSIQLLPYQSVNIYI